MKTKKYNETQRKKTFDWDAYLDRQIEEERDIIEEAGSPKSRWANEFSKICNIACYQWIDCGIDCSILDKDEGDPIDKKLCNLFEVFYGDVDAGKWKEAKKTLAKIKKRCSLLIDKKIKQNIQQLETLGYKVTQPKK